MSILRDLCYERLAFAQKDDVAPWLKFALSGCGTFSVPFQEACKKDIRNLHSSGYLRGLIVCCY
jgi:hypothetical protein